MCSELPTPSGNEQRRLEHCYCRYYAGSYFWFRSGFVLPWKECEAWCNKFHFRLCTASQREMAGKSTSLMKCSSGGGIAYRRAAIGDDRFDMG